MLLDSGYIHEKDAEYLNKRLEKQGKPLIEPLYTKEDAARVAPLFHGLDYEEVFEPIPGVKAQLVDAGRITALDAYHQANNKEKFREMEKSAWFCPPAQTTLHTALSLTE